MSEIQVVFEINPLIPNFISNKLNLVNKKLIQILENSHDVKGVALMTFDGDEIVVLAKNNKFFENLKTINEIVGQLKPKQFFSELYHEIEYKGRGHMSFIDFEVHFARLSDQLVVAFIATDIHRMVFENTKEIISSFKKMLEEDEIENELNETQKEIREEPHENSQKSKFVGVKTDPKSEDENLTIVAEERNDIDKLSILKDRLKKL